MNEKQKYSILINLGRFLFRYRAVIAVPFFMLLVLLSRPVLHSFPAYILLGLGTVLRIWAAGYIGTTARNVTFQTYYRIVNGPYKYLRHPVYLGNSFLVIGVILLYNPPILYKLICILLFIVIYSVIIISEQAYIMQLPVRKTSFVLKNCIGELSTLAVLAAVGIIYYLIPKNLLLK